MKKLMPLLLFALVGCSKSSDVVKPAGTFKINIASGDVAYVAITDNSASILAKNFTLPPFNYSFPVNHKDTIVVKIGYADPIDFKAFLNDSNIDTAPAVAAAVKAGPNRSLSFKYVVPE